MPRTVPYAVHRPHGVLLNKPPGLLLPFLPPPPPLLPVAVVVLAFVLPKAYEAKQDEVDKVLAVVKAKVDEAVTAFNNK